MAIIRVGDLATTPSVRPTKVLDFANSKQLSDVEFSRSSTATYYDGETTTLSDHNLLIDSGAPNGVRWSRSGSSTQPSTSANPFGEGTQAYTLVEDTNNAWHYIMQNNLSGLYHYGAGRYCVSAYVKPAGRNWVLLRPHYGSAANAWFNISTGTVGTVDSGVTANIWDVGNGWYRISHSFDFPSTPTYYQLMIETGDGVTTYQGDGSSGVHIWGLQTEYNVMEPGPYVESSSAGPKITYQNKMLTAATNQAVFDHDPKTGESLGLRVESARENLYALSENRTSMSYLSGSAIVDHQTGIYAPDGQTGTVSLFRDSNTAFSVADLYVQLTLNSTYTMSCYVKANGPNAGSVGINVSQNGGGMYNQCIIDLDAADVVASKTQNGSSSLIATRVWDVGNGWYRMAVTFTKNTTTSSDIHRVFRSADSTRKKASGVYFWGLQCELGSNASSYIPTSGTQVTRSRDIPYLKDSRYLDNREGSIYADIRVDQGSNAYPRILASSKFLLAAPSAHTTDGTIGHPYIQAYDPYQIDTSNSQIIQPFISNRIGASWSSTSWDIATNGVGGNSVTANGSSDFNSGLELGVGHAYGSDSRTLNGTIKKLAFFEKHLSREELIALTEE